MSISSVLPSLATASSAGRGADVAGVPAQRPKQALQQRRALHVQMAARSECGAATLDVSAPHDLPCDARQ